MYVLLPADNSNSNSSNSNSRNATSNKDLNKILGLLPALKDNASSRSNTPINSCSLSFKEN